MKPEIELGYYSHFKGRIYQVFGVVRHSETREWMVCYGFEEPEEVREMNMFLEYVTLDGQSVPRFKFLETYLPILGGDPLKEKEFY